MVLVTALALASACGGDDEGGDDGGGSGKGGSAAGSGGTAGSGTAGKGGGGGGSGGTAGTAGSTSGSSGTAGATAGSAGSAGTAGSAGSAGTAGSAGSAGSAGTAGSAGSAGSAGTGGDGPIGGQGGEGGEAGELSAGQGGQGAEGGEAGASSGGAGGEGTGGTAGTGGGGTGGTGGGGTGGTEEPPNLIFSEYVENQNNASSPDAVEIYNASDDPIDLSSCRVLVFINGAEADEPTAAIPLSGLLAEEETFVVCGGAIGQLCTIIDGDLNVTGDDALAIDCLAGDERVMVDVIGQIGSRPPSGQWGDGTPGTQDQTLRRNCNVSSGDRNGGNAFDPATQWTSFPVGTTSDLGNRSCP